MELDLQARYDEEKENMRFVETMYPYFGLEENPGYCKILIRPLLLQGGLSKSFDGAPLIVLKDTLSPEERRYTNWHESSHFLHRVSNPDFDFSYMERMRLGQLDDNVLVLSERVADLGALTFLDLTEGLNDESMGKYDLGPKMNASLDPEEIEFLFKTAVEDKSYLKTLVKQNINKLTK